jgi:hypothetical protein
MPNASPISILIDGLVSEASQAPRLFSDLAKIERYIAESYKTRALIELLQNADDAGATEFVAQCVDDALVVANNGRAFTTSDVEALCRSGASNKHRGGTTIGYRGIGFKSVVNLAERVWIFSGEHRFLFDRERTRSVLGSEHDVPLIRIPHLAEADGATERVVRSWRSQYCTVFFFDSLDARLLHEEAAAFEGGCLLFLNHLERVTLRVGGEDRAFVRSPHVANGRRFLALTGTSAKTSWEVLSGQGDRIARVALKMEEDRIVAATVEEATIHSFTPTTEYAGVPVKLNGDFTTDPSRKTVDLDSTSTGEFLISCSVLCQAVRAAVERQTDRPGLFGALTSQVAGDGRFRPLFWKTMSSILAQTEIALPGGFRGPMTSMRLRPEWLNHIDYEIVCAGRWPHVNRDLLVTYPELELFLGAVGARRLTLDDALGCAADADLSIRGRAELFARCVAQFRYDCDGDRLRWLRQVPLFPTTKGVLTAECVSGTSDLIPDFLCGVSQVVEASDLAFMLKRFGLQAPINPAPAVASLPTDPTAKPFLGTVPAIARWRSAERNALEYIKAIDAVLDVSDVSQANLGHDLEVTMRSGKRRLVEVKSVASFAEPFRLTSNEYATACSSGPDYILAIVVNGDQFDIRFIFDPASVLSFERRCERWSWQCSEYASAASDPEQIFSSARRTKE